MDASDHMLLQWWKSKNPVKIEIMIDFQIINVDFTDMKGQD